MQKSISFFLFVFVLIIVALQSTYFFYLWDVKSTYINMFCLIMSILFTKRTNTNIVYIIVSLLLLFVSLLWGTELHIPIDEIIICGIIYNLLSLSDIDKQIIINIWTYCLGIILSLSLVGYLLIPFGLLPNLGVISYGSGAYYYLNYGITIALIDNYASIPRFNSLFLEPGHVAMISCFTLFLNKYDFSKKRLWMIAIPLLFTLSLAGYVIGFWGYVLYVCSTNKISKTIKYIVYIFLGGYVFWIGAQTYNGGHNIINEVIIERLTFDEDKGIVGNNRFHGYVDQDFDKYLSDGTLLYGLGYEKFTENVANGGYSGAGYKMFMLKRGILGTIFIFLFYFMLCRMASNRRFCYGFLGMFILTFFQRAYPFMLSWLILFALAVRSSQDNKLDSEEKKLDNKF